MSGNTLTPASNRLPLFVASCTSLVTTSMVFATRGAIEGPMSEVFHLTKEQVGQIWGPSFWGFTIAIFMCGFLVDFLGMRLVHILSSLGYLLGLGLVLTASKPAAAVASIFDHAGTTQLFAGFLLMGLAQGAVEGVVNPLVATLYKDKKTKMLNMLHAWWPGGMIIGGLAAYFLAKSGIGWQIILGTLSVPALIALVLACVNRYPQTERVASNISMGTMVKQIFNPFFLLLFGLMWVTAASELGPDQWFPTVMGKLTGQDTGGVLFLVYTAGLMFVLRFFFGGLVHKFSPFAVLGTCSVLAMGGLFWLGSMSPPAAGMSGSGVMLTAYVAATLFGIGKTFYWPTMLGVTSERFPKGGALLMNLMGGVGMLSIAVILPYMGSVMDSHKDNPSLVLKYVSFLPGGLAIVFAVIALVFKSKGGYKAVSLSHAEESPAVEM